MSDILVAFATRAGSTEQVAAAITEALRKSGNTVDLRRARDVREPGFSLGVHRAWRADLFRAVA